MVPFVHESSECVFLAAGAWLLVLQDCSDTGVTIMLSTAAGEMWLPSNMPAYLTEKIIRYFINKLALVASNLQRCSHLQMQCFERVSHDGL